MTDTNNYYEPEEVGMVCPECGGFMEDDFIGMECNSCGYFIEHECNEFEDLDLA
jgi:uncharacterized OB-fold protein